MAKKTVLPNNSNIKHNTIIDLTMDKSSQILFQFVCVIHVLYTFFVSTENL